MMGDNVGHIVELAVSNVAHGGVMVARLNGRVVFVADAIPGETVRAVITDDAKEAFWRADTVEVLAASEHRRDHVWPAASVERPPDERAGGAEFGHIALDHQRELKRRVLVDALERMAKVPGHDVTVESLPGNADGTAWRTRIRLHVDADGIVGPFAARSHRVIAVSDLPLATLPVAAAAPLGKRRAQTRRSHIDVVGTAGGDVLVLPEGAPDRTITEAVGEREFRLEGRGFWQVHEHAARALTSAVQDALDPERFEEAAPNLDLYGGVGLFAAALGESFGPNTRVTTVESDAAATRFAELNLAEWDGAVAVNARVDRYLATQRENAGLFGGASVILDPPRSGAGRHVVDSLAALRPAQIVYVACDPVALARDVALLAARGYVLRSIRAFDLFPNTHHLEAVASFVRG